MKEVETRGYITIGGETRFLFGEKIKWKILSYSFLVE